MREASSSSALSRPVAEATMSRPHLVFVHVGKCAGSSVSTALALSGVRFSHIHGVSQQPLVRDLVANPDVYFLISTRDPIRRFVSAFNWDLHDKRERRGLSGPDGRWANVFEAFPSANSLAEALSSTNQERRMLAVKGLRHSYLHIHLGISWYVPLDVAQRLPAERTSVLRVEHLDRDFASFCVKYGLPRPSRFFPLPREKANYRPISAGPSDQLSAVACQNLEVFLAPDYDVNQCLQSRGLLGESVADDSLINSIVCGNYPGFVSAAVARRIKWCPQRSAVIRSFRRHFLGKQQENPDLVIPPGAQPRRPASAA